MITMPIEVYTDGSCIKNPGAGGAAYIIRYWEQQDENDMPVAKTIEFNQGYRLTTNNRMEILAGIEGANKVISLIEDGTFSGATQVNIITDSEYFSNSINQRWIDKWQQNNWMTSGFRGSQPTDVKNKDLWEKVIEFKKKFQELGITFNISWVKGHDMTEFNNKADNLAQAASHDTTNHLIDTIYEQTAPILNRR